MPYNEVNAKGEFNPMHNFEDNAVIEGVYKGCREVKTKTGTSKVHTISADLGDTDFWGSTVLDDKLRGLEDKRVKVEYRGIPKGKRYKNFSVLVWED